MSDSPADPLSVISIFFGPISKLREAVKKYLKKKKTENLFISALETEATAYMNIFEEMSDYGRNQVKPVLLEIKEIPTITQMNALMEVASEVPLLSIKLLRAFINLASACSEVSQIEGFMKSLEETNLPQFDFVKRMAAVYVPENSVVLDGTFFRYFKMYQNSFKMPKKVEADSEIEDIKKSIKYVKKWMDHARTRKPRIAKKISKRYVKNMKKFGTVAITVNVKSSVLDPQEYIPSSLSPLVALIEEVF